MTRGAPGADLLAYHGATRHSPDSVARDRHRLDWENQPLPFKIYEDAPRVALPRRIEGTATPTDTVVGTASVGVPVASSVLDATTLARLLHLSAGITRRVRLAHGGEQLFRAAACTGALYHIDLYVVCGALDGVGAGVWHFGPHDFALARLRDGDWRGRVAQACARTHHAEAYLVAASTWWRNAWKYRARAYRHAFWDAGTMLANTVALAASAGVAARVDVGFVDDAINGLLGLDVDDEGAVAVVALGAERHEVGAVDDPEPIRPVVRSLSASPLRYEAIAAAHRAGSLPDAGAVRAYRAHARGSGQGDAAPPTLTLPAARACTRGLDATILRRGSSRRFSGASIEAAELAAVLDATRTRLHTDWQAPGATDVFVIVNAVEGVERGAWRLAADPNGDAQTVGLALLRAEDARRTAGGLALGQPLARDAAANLYFLADAERIAASPGGRLWRAAGLEGGLRAGLAYLAAYARPRLGATGLTFFDDEVIDFFGPAAAGRLVAFLLAVGRPGAG